MITQTAQRVSFGYTPITPEIKKMIHDLISEEYTLANLAHDLNMGYRGRTNTMKKILGTTNYSYKTIRIDIVEKLKRLQKNNGCVLNTKKIL